MGMLIPKKYGLYIEMTSWSLLTQWGGIAKKVRLQTHLVFQLPAPNPLIQKKFYDCDFICENLMMMSSN